MNSRLSKLCGSGSAEAAGTDVSASKAAPTGRVAPPVKAWGGKEIAIDAFHHAVYAAATHGVPAAVSHFNSNTAFSRSFSRTYPSDPKRRAHRSESASAPATSQAMSWAPTRSCAAWWWCRPVPRPVR